MAQTTTSVNACDVVIELDNADGTLTDISGSSNQCGMSMSSNVGETNTFDGQWAIRRVCKTSVNVSLQAVYSTADVEALNTLADWWFAGSYGDARTCTISVPDDTAGSDEYTGEFVLTSLNIPLSADDAAPILVTAELQNQGAFSRATIAS